MKPPSLPAHKQAGSQGTKQREQQAPFLMELKFHCQFIDEVVRMKETMA